MRVEFEEVTIGDCRLILGDCREVLPLLPSVDNGALDAWRERVAIVRFCSGIEMTEQQAQRIVQMQMGISDEEWEEMKKKDSGK